MEPVVTHKLDRGTVFVFGNVTQEMVAWYVGVWVLVWWFDRAMIGNQLVQMGFPLLVLIPLHFVVVALLELPVVHVIVSAFRFEALTADRYRLTHDPNPLPFLIPSDRRPVKARRGLEPRSEEVSA